MLSTYVICAAIGGLLVILAAMGGLDGVDLDGADLDGLDLEAEVEIEGLETDVELVDMGGREDSHPSSNPLKNRPRPRSISVLSLLLSLKFWSFGSCFFGLTGLLFSFLQPQMPAQVVLLLAVGVGLICGTGMAGVLQALRQRQVDSLVRSSDLVGLLGTVELPFDAQSRGKVRLQVKGSMVDCVAYTDAPEQFTSGDRVVVVGTEHHRVWVVSEDSIRRVAEGRDGA